MMGLADGFRGQRLVVVPARLVAGSRRQPLLAGLLPTDVGVFPAAAGHERRRMNGIDQTILIACLHGAGWVEAAGRRRVVTAGQMLVMAPGEPHAYGADIQHPWTIRWLHVSGTQVRPWLGRLGVDRVGVLPLPDPAAVTARHEAVLAALEGGDGDAHLLAAVGATWHLLATLATAPAAAGDPIDRACRLMTEHLDKPLTVADLAAVAGLSPSRFTARFRAARGSAPLDHFLRLKMRHAAALLEAGDDNVATIAGRLGYDDAFYFSRRFRAVFGLSPTAWRRQRRG